ncbi:MAG: TetR/AcrR family transcriptional regulator [Pseudonocardia sp.]|nr:TetR/AcrR family transcriptional regulator [Pseudonocardia sp.]
MSSSVTRRTRNARGSGAQLRSEIVQAARGLLIETGAESAVTLRAVARRVGIAAPSIYTHFDSPEQIVQAVVTETFSLLEARIDDARRAAATPRDRLIAGCRAYLAFGAEHSALYGLLFARDRRPDPPPTHPPGIADIDGSRPFQLLMHGTQDCIDDGSSSADSALETAVQIWVALHGLVQLRANEPDFPWPDADRTEVELIIRLGRLTS